MRNTNGHDDTLLAPPKEHGATPQDKPGSGRRATVLRGSMMEPEPPAMGPQPPAVSLAPAGAEVIGDRYVLEEKLGEGSFGKVYKARHAGLNIPVVIKIQSHSLEGDTGQREDTERRFRLEAQSVARIKHKNVVAVTDFGKTDDNTLFLVMEYLRAENLKTLIEKEGALPWERAKDITVQICRGLGAAHKKGIVHRDVKPENVLLAEDEETGEKGIVKLIDFGIVKIIDEQMQIAEKGRTRAGLTVGTPAYMSPEQARGEAIDKRTDVYAVGTVLYELVCGTVPFPGENLLKVAHQQSDEQPEPPSTRRPDLHIQAEVERLILKALEKDREKRFASMEEFEAALMAIPDIKASREEAVISEPPGNVAEQPGPEERQSPAPEAEIIATGSDGSVPAVPAKVPFYRKPLAIIALAGGLAVAAGGGLFINRMVRHGSPAGTDAAATIPVVPVVIPDAAETQAAPGSQPLAEERKSVKTCRIKLVTQPADADVILGGKRRGSTPFELELPISGEKTIFTVRKRGYREETFEVVPDQNKEMHRNLVHGHFKKRDAKGPGKVRIPDYLKQ